ncbi:hypothetical protein B0I22_0203 [Epilithonimonas xixisoli]|uniref:Uncharacterized protein n=1 Tax=Epilithonimonas xixisoli TaxID=1476462 RepID=A0A4R8I837_9FLAO|nr:hypothetical protein B0I22_0203 [Epilithonimonas xixisoli]
MELKLFLFGTFLFGTLLFLNFKLNENRIEKINYPYYLLNIIFFSIIGVGYFYKSKIEVKTISDLSFVFLLDLTYILLGNFLYIILLTTEKTKNYFYFITLFCIGMAISSFIIAFFVLILGILFEVPGL